MVFRALEPAGLIGFGFEVPGSQRGPMSKANQTTFLSSSPRKKTKLESWESMTHAQSFQEAPCRAFLWLWVPREATGRDGFFWGHSIGMVRGMGTLGMETL